MTTAPDISLPGEEWRTIKDFPKYLVSNFGRIYSQNMSRLVAIKRCNFVWVNGKTVYTKREYYAAQLHNKKIHRGIKVHRIVAATFCPNDDPETKTVVDHIDNDPLNNMAANLRWVTPYANLEAGKNDEVQKYTRWLLERTA